jgi:hypothetical protein
MAQGLGAETNLYLWLNKIPVFWKLILSSSPRHIPEGASEMSGFILN